MKMIVSSVAPTFVTTTARRESPVGLLHRVLQPRGEAEWLVRDNPGICSQHCAVVKARPAPEKASSPPCSAIVTAPPGAPPLEVGFGPQASPQSGALHDSLIPLAVQLPLRVGRSLESPAVARPGMSHSAENTTVSGQQPAPDRVRSVAPDPA